MNRDRVYKRNCHSFKNLFHLFLASAVLRIFGKNRFKPNFKPAQNQFLSNVKLSLVSIGQGTLTVGGSITVQLVSSLTSLDKTVTLHNNDNIFSFLVKSNLFKLDTSFEVILPPTVRVYCKKSVFVEIILDLLLSTKLSFAVKRSWERIPRAE